MNISIYDKILSSININKNDNLFISSDMTTLLFNYLEQGIKFDCNLFIEAVQEKIGSNGTLIFPTYNWMFCKGETFDYNKTLSKTGIFSKVALKRDDFKRTKHPIYSFAVWGKNQKELYELENISSFGIGSPFDYMYHYNYKNLFIDVSYQDSFTFVHYIEEVVGGENIDYRYMKDFTSDYIDENNNKSERTYSMFVRDIEKNTVHDFTDITKDIDNGEYSKKYTVDGSEYTTLMLRDIYPMVENDIKYNRSKRIAIYDGQ